MKLVFVIALLIQFAWNRLLTLLNCHFIEANGSRLSEVLPAILRPHIDQEDYQRAGAYARARAALGSVESAFTLIIVICVITFSLLGPIDRYVMDLPLHRVCFVLTVMFMGQLLDLPFRVYNVFGIERRFGFNRTTPRVFVMDLLKSAIVSVVVLTPLLWFIFWIYDWTGPHWWIWGFALFSAFQVLMMVLYPLVIAPLFNRFTPLPEGELLQRIRHLCDKVGFPLRGVFVVDGSRRSRHSNAYFTGVGRAKRIVLYDTLIDSLSQEELLAVLSHELGHFKHHHVRMGLILSIGLSLLGFYSLAVLLQSPGFFLSMGYDRPSIHIGLVLLVLMLPALEMLAGPAFNLLSRRHEYQADAFTVQTVGETHSLSQALIKLNRDNLATLLPHPLYSFIHYSHPPLAERLLGIQKHGTVA